MEKEYYFVTIDVSSKGVYSLDQIEGTLTRALEELDLPNTTAHVASVHYVTSKKDEKGYYKVEGKQY